MDDHGAGIRRKIESWFDKYSDEMIKDLERLVAVKSVRGLPEEGAPYGLRSREALSLACSMLEQRGFEVGWFEDIMITADFGPGPPKMGILAHLDVVDAGEGWDTDPYEMVIRDGRIFGRGVLDNKGPSVAAMYAMYCVRDLFPDLQSGFRLILGSGEETGCDAITLHISKNEPPPHVFTPDADYPLVNTEKGRAAVFFGASWAEETTLPRIVSVAGGKTMNVVPNRAEAVIEGISLSEAEVFCREYSDKTNVAITARPDGDRLIVTAEGESTHAATPQRGRNAQTALVSMLAAMQFSQSKGFHYIRALNRLFPHGDYHGRALGVAMSDDISGALTLNFGVLRLTGTGFAGNFDSRTSACADDTDLLGIIRAAFESEGIALTNSTLSKCHHTPEDSVFVRALLQIYSEYTGKPGFCLAVGGQTYVHDIPGGLAFGCNQPGVFHNIHGANEFYDVEQLIESAEMFAHAIVDMCSQP